MDSVLSIMLIVLAILAFLLLLANTVLLSVFIFEVIV